MASKRQQADQVLKAFSNRRGARACYPCAKRKIRCSGGQPCSTCSQRGHPDICFLANERSKPARTSHRGAQAGSGSASAPSEYMELTTTAEGQSEQTLAAFTASAGQHDASPLGEPHHQSVTARSALTPPQPLHVKVGATSMGKLSGATFVSERLEPRNRQLSQDIRPGLGLESILPADGLFGPHSETAHAELLQLSPKRREVLRLFPPFRSYIQPFHHIISDVDALELSMFRSLDSAEASGNNSSVNNSSASLESVTQKQGAEVALFLAILAVGAQFTDLPGGMRAHEADGLARRSMGCLRLSDFLLRPAVETVQTFLLIGMYLQNSGRSDGAWSLLGLTLRLAQSIGLQGDSRKGEHFIWMTILWQDCSMSLRFDRKPMHLDGLPSVHGAGNADNGTTYFGTMHAINFIGCKYLVRLDADRFNSATSMQQIQDIDIISDRALPHLKAQESCSSMQQRLECLALQMHTSFLAAEISRPFLIESEQIGSTDATSELKERCVRAMMNTVQSYLDMAKMSILPLRSWSLIHEALSCTCVLVLLRQTRSMQSVQSLVESVRELLEIELASDDSGQDQCNWTFHRAVRLLKHLRPRERNSSRQADIPGNHVSSGENIDPTHEPSIENVLAQCDQVEDGTMNFDFMDPFDGPFADMTLPGADMSLSSLFDASTNVFIQPDSTWTM